MSINVVEFPNILSAERLVYTAEQGKTYRELVGEGSALVFCDGLPVPESQWDQRPNDGSYTLIRRTPGAPIVGVLAAIPWFIYVLVGLLAVAYTAAAIEQAQLRGLANTNTDTFETLPGVRGGSNKISKWGAVPIVLGKHYIAPPYVAAPYTEIGGSDGDTQYVHLAFILGHGPLRITELRIGENLLCSNSSSPVDNGALVVDGSYAATDIQVTIAQGNATALTYYPAKIVEDQFSMEVRRPDAGDVPLYRTTRPNTKTLSVDFEFPGGLITYGTNGALTSASVTFSISYRLVGAGSWTVAATITLTKTLNRTARYSYAYTPGAVGQYEVRIIRTSLNGNDSKVRNVMTWLCLRSEVARLAGTAVPLTSDTVANAVVRLSIKAKADSVISGQLGEINCIVQQIIPMWDGTTGAAHWASAANNSAALATNPIIANPAAQCVYLLRLAGVPDSDIDFPAFETLYTSCMASGGAGELLYESNAVLDTQVKLRDALTKILSVCRASLRVKGNVFSVIQDTVRTTPIALITPRDSFDFQGTKAFPKIPHGYRIKYVNRAAGYIVDECIVLADGYHYDLYNDGVQRIYDGTTTLGVTVLATEIESIERWGLTTKALAYRAGRYLLAMQYLRPEIYSVKQDVKQLACERGDLILLGHDVPLSGVTGGRVVSVTNDGAYITTVTLDEVVTRDGVAAYGIRYQKSDGRVLFANVANTVGSSKTVTLTAPNVAIADGPVADDLLWFGLTSIGETKPCVVIAIEPADDLAATIYMQDYAPGVFTADAGAIPAYESGITRPVAVALSGIGATPPNTALDAAGDAQLQSIVYANNTPPSNNATALTLTAEPNADGSINVVANWSFDPTGLVKADGFLVYYKSATSAPGAIDLVLDPRAFVAADEASTAYAHVLAALSVRYGGIGAVTRHYRFAVVAVGTRRSGTIPHNSGVVENTGDTPPSPPAIAGSTWIDATFAPNIGADDGTTALSIEAASLVWRDASTGLERARASFNATRDMLCVSKLAGLVAYKGSWIMGTWGAYSVIESASSEYAKLVVLSDSRVLCVYQDITTGYIRQKIRDTGGTWGAYSVVESAGVNHLGLCVLPDGRVLCVYQDITTGYIRQKIRDTGGTWGAYSVVESAYSAYTSLCVLPDGRVLCVYTDSGTGYIRQKIRDTGGTWGAYSVVESVFSRETSICTLPDGRVLCVYRDNSSIYIRQKIRDTDGTWGAYSVVESNTSYSPHVCVLPDGRVLCVYRDGTGTNYLRQKIRGTGGTWGAYSVVESVFTQWPSLCVLPDGKILCVYQDNTTQYLRQKIDTSAYSAIPLADLYEYSGAGIVESGSNSNGSWIKFADGTMECWGTTAAIAPAGGFTITLPVTFLSISLSGISMIPLATNAGNPNAYPGSTSTLVAWTDVSGNSYMFYAIGRWK